VVVTSEASHGITAVVGVDAHTGAEKWRHEVAETFAPFACGTLVCTEQGPEETAALVARDSNTGADAWTSPGLQSSVVNDNGTLIEFHLGAPVLYSLDPATGKERWHADLTQTFGRKATTDNGWDALMVGDALIASVGDGAVGLDPASGAVKWKVPGQQICPVHVKTIAILCGDTAGVRRVDPATGKDMWVANQFVPASKEGPFLGVLSDGSALVGTDKAGHLISINTASGAVGPPAAGSIAWMFIFKTVKARVGSAAPDDYGATFDPLPWDPSANGPATVTKASDVPAFVGSTVAGYRVFVDGTGNVRGLPASS
jgi:hypothetical protein